MRSDGDGKVRAGRPSAALPAPECKQDFVRALFDVIAPRYDLLNGLLSLRLHRHWRRVAADQAALHPGDRALDVCTGTADFALELARRVGRSGQIVGTDFSLPMLRLGADKARRHAGGDVRLALADTQQLPFSDGVFDAVTVAFGIRNVADPARSIAEMARVTRPGGRVVLLEFNRPTNPAIAAAFRLYSFGVMPRLGGLLAGQRAAYTYLPASVQAFASREDLTAMMRRAGLTQVHVIDLHLGIVVVHCGLKGDKIWP